jgi:hypothetical protein
MNCEDNEKPSYYAIIPANVRYDNELNSLEKLLYGEFSCLSNKNGYCYSSNKYFANLYNVTPQAISKYINHLAKKNYIRLEYIYNGKEIKERRIFLQEVSTRNEEVSTENEGGINSELKGYQLKIKDNNTSNNITSINNIYMDKSKNREKSEPKKRFQKPSLEELKAYIQEHEYSVDAERFFDYYESNGWKVGKNPMKDWKACVRTWQKNEGRFNASAPKKHVNALYELDHPEDVGDVLF